MERVLAVFQCLVVNRLKKFGNDVVDRLLLLFLLVFGALVLDLLEHHRQELLKGLPVGLHLLLNHLEDGCGHRSEILILDRKGDDRVE